VKILLKIKEAKTPDRFTQDFLKTVLGFKSGSANAFIPLAKRLGLLNTDGTPTELYKSFRNPTQSKIAMAKAIREGYSTLFNKNEYVYKLNRVELEGLVMELTGLDKTTTTLAAICGTFDALKEFADFEQKEAYVKLEKGKEIKEHEIVTTTETIENDKINLSYIINIVLPKSDDIAVFNAIFKSLKENLLRK
jgi:hypothetical protein